LGSATGTVVGTVAGAEAGTDPGEAVPAGRPNARFWAICAWDELDCCEEGDGMMIGLSDADVEVDCVAVG